MPRIHSLSRFSVAGRRWLSSGPVAFLGNEHSFSHVALGNWLRITGLQMKSTPIASAALLTQAVATGEVDMGILPIETSSQGPLLASYDSVLAHPELRILSEYSCRERHCLAVNPGVKLGAVERVMSHADILTSCSEYLSMMEQESGKQLRRVAVASSTSSCEQLAATGATDMATISTEEAAKANGLEVLTGAVGNDQNSQTRYVVVGREGMEVPAPNMTPRKNTVLLAIKDEPSEMFRIMGHLALRGINIKQVVLRPVSMISQHTWKWVLPSTHWSYIFFVEWESKWGVDRTCLLKSLEESSQHLHFLGEYPSYVQPEQYQHPAWKSDWQDVLAVLR